MYDVGELEALIDRVYEPTRRYALRRALPDEAEDAVSETMLLLWQQPERIPKGSEVGWAIGICRKVLANMRRKRLRRESLLGRFVTQLLPAAPAPVISREPEISAALSALPPSHPVDNVLLVNLAPDDLESLQHLPTLVSSAARARKNWSGCVCPAIATGCNPATGQVAMFAKEFTALGGYDQEGDVAPAGPARTPF